MSHRTRLLGLTAAAALLALPAMAQTAAPGTRAPDGAPGNPPGTAVGRAVDRTLGTNATGANPGANAPDGTTAANPPGTAVGRAIDGATGTPTSRDGTGNNPPGTAVGRAVDRATTPDGAPGNPPGTAVGRAVDRAVGTNATGTNPSGAAAVSGAAAGGMAATANAAGNTALREGRRASRVIGSTVYNEANDSIGSVDDLIVPREGGAPVAILSVGGFLGIGAKLVAVPYNQLRWNMENSRWALPGVTKDSLTALPTFEYEADRRG